jgi:hypothetical protein
MVGRQLGSQYPFRGSQAHWVSKAVVRVNEISTQSGYATGMPTQKKRVRGGYAGTEAGTRTIKKFRDFHHLGFLSINMVVHTGTKPLEGV